MSDYKKFLDIASKLPEEAGGHLYDFQKTCYEHAERNRDQAIKDICKIINDKDNNNDKSKTKK